MNRFQLSFVVVAALFVSTVRAADPAPFELRDGDRVALIGGTFIEREQNYSYLETLLQSRWPDRKISFRNLGWSGDDVFGASRGYFELADAGFARLTKIVHGLKPNVIFVGYGMTESFDGPAGLPRFVAGLEKHLDMLKPIGARETILIGPIRHENLGPPFPGPSGHNKSLRAYTDAMRDIAARRGHRFIDLYDLTDRAPLLTYNGIHLTEAGYWHAARAIEARLGLQSDSNVSRKPDGSIANARLETIRQLAIRKNVQYFNQWRPANETYIFGFRQHEQGKNAAEMPQFTPPIEKLEDALAQTAQGKAVTVEDVVDKPSTDPQPDPELERRSFKVADGFEVNLFAADPLLAKPIQMNWDAKGRLWVASSSMYPQIKPGEIPTDKVIVLEDTNFDGKADKSTVFADDLLIPTGLAPTADGGVYVANSTEMLHLADTDGDLKADTGTVVLSGFGTEDTHHNIHTFHWGPDGRLYFNQSIYIHSHLETPWGTNRLMAGGTWRFRPDNYQIEVFTRGMVNGWGHAHDRWGQSFGTDGAGGEGIHYMFPGAAWLTAKDWGGLADMPRILKGMNPGSPKYCANEVVSGRHLPDDWQGNVIANDFRANRVVRYRIDDEKGTFIAKQMPDVITSTDTAFRPIDVRMGPDGAIYIADWYNPIINHGEVDFRDPRRDKTHGRIWRITAKNRPLVEPPTLVGASVESVLDQLKSPEGWTRQQAKLVLRSKSSNEVLPALAEWVTKLDPNDSEVEHHRLEALWVYQSLDVPEPALLARLLQSKVTEARVAALRVLGDWHDRVAHTMSVLATAIEDDHPRVRVEAVRALARVGTLEAFELALGAREPQDVNVDYALWVTCNELMPVWIPAFREGKLEKGIEFAVRSISSAAAQAEFLRPLRANQVLMVPAEFVGQHGTAEQVDVLWQTAQRGKSDPKTRAEQLKALRLAAQRDVRPPSADGKELVKLFKRTDLDGDSSREAIRLAGAWKSPEALPALIEMAQGRDTASQSRRWALEALADYGAEGAAIMRKLDAPGRPFAERVAGITGLAAVDLKDAASRATSLLSETPADVDPAPLMTAFLQREGGSEALAAALSGKKLTPDAAKLALRHVSGSGRDHPELTERLREAGGLGDAAQPLTPEQLTQLVNDVAAKGDAARGELVFRSASAACFQCHAIAGAGGPLGPDLRAIGASSPVDYLVESIFDPSKAIKDGYHSVVIGTKKGEVFSGIKVSQNDTEIVLRDATNDRIVIPRALLARERAGGSLMPAGLADTLTRGELLDLVKFLSELGKPGRFQPDNAVLIRRWRVSNDPAAMSAENARWLPAYSMVSGVLPRDALASSKDQTVAFARGEIDVTTAGLIGLRIENVNGISAWIGAKAVEVKQDVEVELSRGVHALTFQIDLKKRGAEGLRVEVRDVPGSTGHAQPVGGS